MTTPRPKCIKCGLEDGACICAHIAPQNSRDALITRVRKLSKMTTANGCSESEANFAAEKIAAIMAEHALTQDELSIKADAAHCIQDEFIFFGKDFGEWYALTGAIARLYSCRTWGSYERNEDILGLGFSTQVKPFVFYGFATDVCAAISTMSICFTAVATEADRQRSKKRDFGMGMVARLCQRVNDMKKVVPTGTALIVLKDQLVTAEFTKLGLKLGKARASTRKIDSAAYAKGFAAGAHVNISSGSAAMAKPSSQPRALGRG